MSALQGKRILVVEDEPIIGFALEDMLLGMQSSRVRIVTRVHEALEAARQGHFDAAILDVNIHGERSYEVARTLRQHGVPFIFASGYGDSFHPPDFRGWPTLTKPYSSRDVEHYLTLALTGANRSDMAGVSE